MNRTDRSQDRAEIYFEAGRDSKPLTIVSRGGLLIVALVLVAMAAGCSPNETRPGITLTGTEAPWPADWRFTDATKEIQIQVHTPFLVPHSVTIWCAEVDGELYVAANQPKTKHWPAWADRDPNVRLSIAGKIYAAHLVPLDDADTVAKVRAAYAAKYQLNAAAPPAEMGEVRYWHVTAPTTAS